MAKGQEPAASFDTIHELLPKANDGDPKALTALRAALAASPEYARQLGDVGEPARLQVIGRIAGQNTVGAEAVAGRLERLRRELAGPAPTPLEALLVERIVTNHLVLARAEMAAAQNEGTQSIRQADYGQRTVDRAQKRYLAAIKALAAIRRLPLPVVQLNVAAAGGQQVNVA